MLDRFSVIAVCGVVATGILTLAFPEAGVAALVVAVLGTAAIFIFRKYSDEEKIFVTKIFLIALAVRLAFGILVHFFDLREFFGGDANTYDIRGNLLAELWAGRGSASATTSGPGWGMYYIVGGLYTIFGRNILAAQSFCAVFGAATAPLVYFCSQKLFKNRKVSRFSAIGVAIFPSFIIWSSQLMKDGLIIFLLVLSFTMVLQLQEKFNYGAVLLLVFSLFGIIALRFYIFYMVAIAVAGSFIVGTTNSIQSLVRRSLVLVLIGVSLTYLGVIRNAGVDFENYGDLKRVQISRLDLSRAGSGFGEKVDVSTPEGAISVIPLGFAYLMLAPFPWQMANLRQASTLPEVLLWWSMIPLLISGLWYTMKNKLRAAFPVLLFTVMLTLAYSIFQGNVGTAYRQRTQIQVFLFMFIGVGWTLYQERKEDKRALNAMRHRRLVTSPE
ncbi:MAG: phospholipid carrier-dependent glycosyltransferase [Pyrinomonadaceae bacterium]